MKLAETIEIMREITELQTVRNLHIPQISIFDTQSKEDGYWLYLRANNGTSELFDHLKPVTEKRNLTIRKIKDYFVIQSR